MIILIKDHNTLEIDAIVVTQTTTKSLVESTLGDVECYYEEMQERGIDVDVIDDLAARLPSDCQVFTEWRNEFETLFY